MNRLSHLLRTCWLDVLVLLAAAEAALEVLLRQGADEAPDVAPLLGAVAVASLVLPLLGRRQWPFAAPASVWLLASAFSFADGQLVGFSISTFAAGVVAAFLLGNVRDPAWSRAGLVVVLIGAAVIVYNAPDASPAALVLQPVIFAMPWLAGLTLQQRGARAEAAEQRATFLALEREAATRAAIADERARIARELHDVLGHSLSVMTIQASAVRRVLQPGQEKEREALLAVEQTGRDALTEMRRLVGILRRDDEAAGLEPQPGLDQLTKLVDQARELGLPVDLRVEGDPVPLPPGIDLTAYRLIQEGLTNARKHARPTKTVVVLRYTADGLDLEVCDDGAASDTPDGVGHGLIGMRERVSIYGGEFEAGPRPGGGFRMHARLPVQP